MGRLAVSAGRLAGAWRATCPVPSAFAAEGTLCRPAEVSFWACAVRLRAWQAWLAALLAALLALAACELGGPNGGGTIDDRASIRSVFLEEFDAIDGDMMEIVSTTLVEEESKACRPKAHCGRGVLRRDAQLEVPRLASSPPCDSCPPSAAGLQHVQQQQNKHAMQVDYLLFAHSFAEACAHSVAGAGCNISGLLDAASGEDFRT